MRIITLLRVLGIVYCYEIVRFSETPKQISFANAHQYPLVSWYPLPPQLAQRPLP